MDIFVLMMIKQTDYIASLAKGLRLIEVFGADAPRLSITQAANASGLDRATTRRILLTLHQEGYADHDGKFFTLTPRVLRLGVSAIASLPLAQIVQPWLDQLSGQIGQSCSVALLDEIEIVYIARAAQKRVMSIGLMPGSRLPAFATSLGRVLLSALPVEEARSRIEASDLSPRTPYSMTESAQILEQVALVRSQGFAIVDQEIELGLRSIAVPLIDQRGRIVAAINIGLAATQETADELSEIYLPKLLDIQSGLKRIL